MLKLNLFVEELCVVGKMLNLNTFTNTLSDAQETILDNVIGFFLDTISC